MASLSVKIIDDQIAERAEEFFLDLEIPPNAVDVGVYKESPDSATVCIEGNDDECCSIELCFTEHSRDTVHLHKCLPSLPVLQY